MSVGTFIEAAHAAEFALAGMALRAIHARAVSDEPEVLSLRLTVTPDALPGLAVIELEFVNRQGEAVGGVLL